MDNNGENNENNAQEIDWDDDSGVIHTVSHMTVQTPDDGWQEVQRLNGVRAGDNPQYIKGRQFHYTYVTDDYRKVMPAQIIATIIIVLFCIGAWFLSPIAGVLLTIFGIAWIVGSWKQKTIKRWKNQAQNLKEDKERQNFDGMDKK